MDSLFEDRVELERLEESLWQGETRFDRAYMEEILAADYFEIGRSGRLHSRQETLDAPASPIAAELPLTDFKIRALSRDVVQVTYVNQDELGGQPRRARRCSIWSRTPQGWRLRFHQGTPLDNGAA